MNFKTTDGVVHELNKDLRNALKPGWAEMLKPAKPREFTSTSYNFMPMLSVCERALEEIGETLVGKDIMEAGCGFGQRCYLMAKYERTRVKGTDVDEYTINQSPDLNVWSPNDCWFVHDKINNVRVSVGKRFPESVRSKVTFDTVGLEDYETPVLHDMIISFDVLEHVLDLDRAFMRMASSVKAGGLLYHEYNPFFSIDGGHSLCTLDFHYGHCRLTGEDFERYIRDIRPQEEKIAINFFHKCLNRFTRKDILDMSDKHGFDIIHTVTTYPFQTPRGKMEAQLGKDVLPDVKKLYPTAEVEDLLFNSVQLVMRRRG